MDWKTRITLDPAILTGKPIVKGTRISVELVIDLLAPVLRDTGYDEVTEGDKRDG